MGREVRRVPKDWEHPRNERGEFRPLFDRHILEYDDEDEEPTEEEWLMPDWPPGECTHYMMYETCSEGTPISPAFETPEELARWLADTGANAGAGMTASYEGWLCVCQGQRAPTMALTSQGFVSGVEMMAAAAKKGGTDGT